MDPCSTTPTAISCVAIDDGSVNIANPGVPEMFFSFGLVRVSDAELADGLHVSPNGQLLRFSQLSGAELNDGTRVSPSEQTLHVPQSGECADRSCDSERLDGSIHDERLTTVLIDDRAVQKKSVHSSREHCDEETECN